MSQRVLIMGAKGLLGRALLRHVPRQEGPVPLTVFARDKDDLPLEDLDGVARFLREEAVDRILLLAAWTQVDACESDPERAFRINGILPARVGALADRLGLPVLYVSTDYVFDGEGAHAYREYDPARPLGVYGRSKWYGECALRQANARAVVVRTSGLYGPGGPDFVQAIRRGLAEGPVEVVVDEVCSPTCVEDLAPALWQVALKADSGTWHLASGGAVSRYEMARRIAEWTGYSADRVRPTDHARMKRPAPRPRHAPLDCQAAREVFGLSLPSWDAALRRFLESGEDGG